MFQQDKKTGDTRYDKKFHELNKKKKNDKNALLSKDRAYTK